ncbi:MAG TPA: hypothetical protein VGG42_10850 [Acidobacteriaceae bacterium]|jgi:hypothetical protein
MAALQGIPLPRTLTLSLLVSTVALSGTCSAQPSISHLKTVATLASTVPANGDENPYGVARVPVTRGALSAGSFLISNFNNSDNLQGTGTTIVEVAPNGMPSLFARIDAGSVSCPGGIGLTTALVALRSGFVIVGSLPTSDGTSATAQAGCLIVLDSWGHVVKTFEGHGINGPWDMTAVDAGRLAALFVTSVLNGTVAANGSVVHRGTVVRLLLEIPPGRAPRLLNSTVVADGFAERTDPAALVIGPTGVAFDDDSGILYVADTLNNRIAAVPHALFRFSPSHGGFTVTSGGDLNGPLRLVLAPDHELVAANAGDGNLVQINPFTRKQVGEKLVDNSGNPPGAGALFGLFATEHGVYFVDDAANTFNLLY